LPAVSDSKIHKGHSPGTPRLIIYNAFAMLSEIEPLSWINLLLLFQSYVLGIGSCYNIKVFKDLVCPKDFYL